MQNLEMQQKMRRMKARNKSGTVTYIVQTANENQKLTSADLKFKNGKEDA